MKTPEYWFGFRFSVRDFFWLLVHDHSKTGFCGQTTAEQSSLVQGILVK
jgi:hypothetical protein